VREGSACEDLGAGAGLARTDLGVHGGLCQGTTSVVPQDAIHDLGRFSAAPLR